MNEEQNAVTYDFSTIHPTDGDVIILKFDPDIYPEELEGMMSALRSEFPDNKVIAITNSMEVLCEQRDEAIDLLQNMIAHISIIGSERPNIIV